MDAGQDDFLGRLKQYVDFLDSRMAEGRARLSARGMPGDFYKTREMNEDLMDPVSRVVMAYEKSKLMLYDIFPELKSE